MKIFRYSDVLNRKREFSNLDKFYCMSAGVVYEVRIVRGKLTWNNNGTLENCELSPRWLSGRYSIEKPDEIIGVTVEEIFFMTEFNLAIEFKRIGSDTRFRIQRGILEYFTTKHGTWLPRTIDKGVESFKFIVNTEVSK